MLELTNDEPVKSLQGKFAEEDVIDSRDKGAHNNNDNAEQVHTMPELLDLLRVYAKQVKGRTEEQTTLGRPKEDAKHEVVGSQHERELRLRETPHDSGRDERQEQGADQVSVYIARLVVQKGQAGEDLEIIRLFAAIAAEDVLVIPLPFRDVVISKGSSTAFCS